jgi:hypothetical protein
MGLTSLKKVYACHHLFVAVKNYPNDIAWQVMTLAINQNLKLSQSLIE